MMSLPCQANAADIIEITLDNVIRNLLKNICYPESGRVRQQQRHQQGPSASDQNETTMALAHPTTSEVTFESFHKINFLL